MDDAARIAQLEAELVQRDRALAGALEQQTATAEVLRVIASSPTSLDMVLNTLVQSATRLTDADASDILLIKGSTLPMAATTRGHPVASAIPVVPFDDLSVSGRAIRERRSIVADEPRAEHEAKYPASFMHKIGFQAEVVVPLLHRDAALGTLLVFRRERLPFDGRHVALLETFADQAVIAIENARLFGELAELNRTLETRVTEQVGELERVGRLRRYLSPQLADLIVSSGDESILDSHRRQITVVFCDLRGFTAFAETAEPEEVMGVLGEYHAAIGPLIHRFGGTLNHFLGDGLMVFFNDPLPQSDHAERAVRMACAMRERAAELQRGWRRGGHALGFGVGVAVGYATLGRIGFEGRHDYTAIGTVANLAARLCGEATDGQILVSARLHGMVEEFAVAEPLGNLSLKGFLRGVETLSVTGLRNGGLADVPGPA